MKSVGNKLQERYVRYWKRIFDEDSDVYCSKLRTYKDLKCTYNLERYLLLDIDKLHVKNYLKVRISNSRLTIEQGRHKQLEVNKRVCPICLSEIETEFHFIMKCPSFNDQRWTSPCWGLFTSWRVNYSNTERTPSLSHKKLSDQTSTKSCRRLERGEFRVCIFITTKTPLVWLSSINHYYVYRVEIALTVFIFGKSTNCSTLWFRWPSDLPLAIDGRFDEASFITVLPNSCYYFLQQIPV